MFKIVKNNNANYSKIYINSKNMLILILINKVSNKLINIIKWVFNSILIKIYLIIKYFWIKSLNLIKDQMSKSLFKQLVDFYFNF